ncbi:MAG: hypothetical protein IPJ39_19405 [Saprospiraceae bacterium]|nr:hypothetical protein [Saprospiraceae bacterium]
MRIGRPSLGLYARNLKFWLDKNNTFGDPEVNGPGTVAQNIIGVESSQTSFKF